jgi:16S rRNA (guanine527-N7)-methyltransferase
VSDPNGLGASRGAESAAGAVGSAGSVGPITGSELAPRPDEIAERVFGSRLPLAVRYAEWLAGDAVEWGLIGPRERPRLWDRHLVNSALLTELLPMQARVVDVGSGAGLPGLALLCRRGDLTVDLVESMQRRADFLRRCVAALGLADAARVVPGRAETALVRSAVGEAEWVTARAVAPLNRLATWCLPLLKRDGRLLALKGARAEAEVAEYGATIRSLGGVIEDVVRLGADIGADPTTVIVVRRVVR